MNSNQQYSNKLLSRYHDVQNQNQQYAQNNKLFQNNPLMSNSNYYINEAQRLRERQQVNRLERMNESNIDKKKLREAIIQPKKINKSKTDKIEFEKALKKAESEYTSKDGKDYGSEIKNYWTKRNNAPYKTIIKNEDYTNKVFKKKSDLIVHRVTNKDKEGVEEDCQKLEQNLMKHNKELKVIYSTSNETEHKQKFEYNHVFKYRVQSKGKNHGDLKKDKMDYYKKMQEEEEKGNKDKDAIISFVMNDGIFNEDELNEYTNFTDQIKDADDSDTNSTSTDSEVVSDTMGDVIQDYQVRESASKGVNHLQKPTKHDFSGNKVVIKQKQSTNKVNIKPSANTTNINRLNSQNTNEHKPSQIQNQTPHNVSIKKNPRKINFDDKKAHVVHTTRTESQPVVSKKPVNINLSNKNDQPTIGDKYSSRAKKKIISI